MKPWNPRLLLVAGLCLLAAVQAHAQSEPAADSLYTFHTPSRDGIGKTYFGREISQVMGHQGAAWLERRTRVVEERPDRVVEGMGLAPDARVADIGAGTGYFTFRIAEAVPTGRVYAVDVQPEMLEVLHKRIERRTITNVVPVLGAEDDPKLPPESLDAVLLVDAYHEFAHPYEMMQGIRRALRPGGRVFLIEYRGEDPRVPIKPLHKMTQAQAITELEAVGLRWVESLDILPTQHFMVFEKPAEG
ncbi:MAG: class I SAM-dependent methyltransferase [Thiocapsa sp.]|uniref:class I SAM-dependent methyltransferase n=1 Tax=Thiocapsa sp. TaxID=2024551 RepID=UPI001BCEF5F3|nr:class I SAM-dependent methyltransferase [Thiocapsa sp.]QVL48305.1 MAG: class I SAM-dependent methyltransferase [Thiocapsa sp.]